MSKLTKDEKFWAIVDDYEAGDINLTEAMAKLVELNGGNETDAFEDLLLLQAGRKN